MSEFGYVAGRDYVFEDRYANSDLPGFQPWQKSWSD